MKALYDMSVIVRLCHLMAGPYLVHDNVVDGVFLWILVVAEPEAETLRVKAFKVLHKQRLLFDLVHKQPAYSSQIFNGFSTVLIIA